MMPGTGSDTNLSVSLIILFGSAAIMLLPVVVFSGRVSNASYGVVELDEWGVLSCTSAGALVPIKCFSLCSACMRV